MDIMDHRMYCYTLIPGHKSVPRLCDQKATCREEAGDRTNSKNKKTVKLHKIVA